MKIHCSFGIHAARYISCIPSETSPFLIDVPLGPSVVRWNIKDGVRVFAFQAHSDLITCMIKTQKRGLICTVSHSGEVIVWDSEWKKKSFVKLNAGKAIHIAFSADESKLAICSQYNGGKLTILSLDQSANLAIEREISGTYNYAEFCNLDLLITVPETKKDCLIRFLNTEGKKIKEFSLPAVDSATPRSISAVNNQKGLLAISREGRTVDVVDIQTGQLAWRIRVKGSGPLSALGFEGNQIVCPSEDGNVTIWDKEHLLSSVKGLTGSIYYMSSPKHSRLLMCSESSIMSVPLPQCQDPEEYKIHYHKLSCCGVDLHDMVVAGDLEGNVICWKSHDTKPFMYANVKDSVRCLSWGHSGTSIQIGTLDGAVYNWVLGNPIPELLFRLEEGVTCLKWNSEENPSYLAASTVGGILCILKRREQDNQLAIKLAFRAHKPSVGPQNLRFGSMINYAEIWSLAWSPDSLRIATCSEDQTTQIWNLEGELQETLKGHTMAVTCVDWQITSIGEILATCADDQTVRVYRPSIKGMELLHIFQTNEVEDWHTVTYLSLESGGNRLAASTQNGFVFVWSLETKETIFAKKTHLGSIEGLKWSSKHKLLVSCSSDCNIHVYSTLLKPDFSKDS